MLVKVVLVLCCYSMTLFLTARCQEDEVCVPVQRGHPGPPGQKGDPGTCDRSEIVSLQEKLRSQNEQIHRLSKKLQDFRGAEPHVNYVMSNNTNVTMTSINYSRIKEIIQEELRKRNNCPVGLADGRIPDSFINSSSAYLNITDRYGAHLARLDMRPSGGAIGAWRPIQIPPIRSVACSYVIRQRYNRYSSYSSNNLPLTFMVMCPRGCARSGQRVEGTNTYVDSSSICSAGIHDGRISDDGGVVTVQRYPRTRYPGSSRHSISSNVYTSPQGTFKFLPDLYLPWIQVDLQVPKLVTGVVTQGRPTSAEEWVKTFKIAYGDSENDLQMMKFANSTDVVFRGNTDNNSHVKNMFFEPITARFLRLIVTSWNEAISLRLEYLTC